MSSPITESPSTAVAPPPRAHLASVPVYVPGRSAAEAMAEHGIDEAVKLASNEVPFGPLPGVPEAVVAAISDTARYADHDSDVLAAVYAETLGLTRNRVAVGPGSVGLLQQLTLAYAGPDDEVLYPWPSFIAYPQFSGVVAATRVVVPLTRCSIDVDAVLAAVTPRTRIIFIANPNNPVGGAVRSADLLRLLTVAPPDCLVVVDEAYREFVTGADVPNALDHIDRFPNLVVLRTLSKAYGMAGLRVGFMIGDPVVVSAVYATMIPFAVNGPAQAAAMVALRQTEEVARRCAVIVGERQRVAQLLRRRGLGLPEAQGNFWWLPAGGRSADITVALEQRGVVVRPFPTGIRVTVGLPAENERFLVALDEVLTAHLSLTSEWGLPTAERAIHVADLLDEVEERTQSATDDGERRRLDRLGARIAELGDDDLDHVGDRDASLDEFAAFLARG